MDEANGCILAGEAMSDEALRQACEEYLMKWFNAGAKASWCPPMLNDFLRFAQRQQAVGVRKAGNAIKDALNPYSSRFQKPEHVIDWCEATATALELEEGKDE